jgi:cyclophilin family peptidyl-prolyl cis-trans isomerase/HEAT repeat protein
VLLLVMQQRRIYDPFSAREALKGDAALREELAWTLGRVGSELARPMLEELLLDDAPAVRRVAAFSLGQLGAPPASALNSEQALLRVVEGEDRLAAVQAVAALARSGGELLTVLRVLTPLAEEERWARLLPSLYLFEEAFADGGSGPALAAGGLALEDPEMRSWAAFALTRNPPPAALPAVRELLRDPDAQVRSWAAAALGGHGDGGDLARLRPLLADAEAGPVVAALAAGHRLVASGTAAPPDDWRPLLARLCEDPRAGVRIAALEASGGWLLDDTLARLLVPRAEGVGAVVSGERVAALSALVEGGHPSAVDLVRQAAGTDDPRLRTAAGRLAGPLGDGELLTALAKDNVPGVRAAAYRASLTAYARSAAREGDREALAAWVRLAFADPDGAVHAAVFDWLTERPLVDFRELLPAVERAREDRVLDSRLNAVAALVARARSEPRERGGVITELERLAGAADYPLRRAAVEALVSLDQPAVAVGSAGQGRGATVYRDLLLSGLPGSAVELHTARGVVTLRLQCEQTLFTCLSFLQLAGQGFYDGQLFHRVLPATLVQSGDPRGDGWGGPGYTVRDEITSRPFVRGTLGMARPAPDTAGSQFFVTLARMPQLDGRFTAFGEVTAGLDVLDALIEGDRLERVVVLP